MATVVAGGSTFVTTDGITFTTGSFTPANLDLLVALCFATGETSTTWAVTDSLSGTWSKVRRQVKNTSADIMEVWVRDSLVPASSMTCTYSHASGTATGGGICICRAAGITMFGNGAPAIRGQGGQDNQAAAGTPAPALGAVALTGNPTITAVFNATNPGGVTVPASNTSSFNLGYATPTTGCSIAYRNSGFTGTTDTWGGTSASAFCSVVVELNTAVPAASDINYPMSYAY